MPNTVNNGDNTNEENVWVVDTEYNIEPGNNGKVTPKPGQVNYLNVVAATPKKQIKFNPFNIIAPLFGKRENVLKTPVKQKPVAYGGAKKRSKTRSRRSRSRKTYKRRN